MSSIGLSLELLEECGDSMVVFVVFADCGSGAANG